MFVAACPANDSASTSAKRRRSASPRPSRISIAAGVAPMITTHVLDTSVGDAAVGVAVFGVSPFIMTLGMLTFWRGIAFICTSGTPIPITDPTYYYVGNGYLAGVPIPSIILLLTLFAAAFVLHLTPFGRCVYAIGSNEDAAHLSGVPTKRYKLLVYTLSGFCAGIAGMVYSSQLSVGTPIAGEGYELDAIAAVVVGGTSLFGGSGSVFRTFVGTLFIGVLANILNLTGVDPFVQQLAKGALIVTAVFVMNQATRNWR